MVQVCSGTGVGCTGSVAGGDTGTSAGVGVGAGVDTEIGVGTGLGAGVSLRQPVSSKAISKRSSFTHFCMAGPRYSKSAV